MTHPLGAPVPADPMGIPYESPYELTAEQSAVARAKYEALDHHLYVLWDDLPGWQQCGYHRLALVDQLVALQQVDGLATMINMHHANLVTSVAASLQSQGWTAQCTEVVRPLRLLSEAGDSNDSTEVPGQDLESLVRCALGASAAHLQGTVS